MRNTKRLQLLTFSLIAYLIIALVWWSALLFAKNQDAFQAKKELLRIGMITEGIYGSETHFQHSDQLNQLIGEYEKQDRMIFLESIFFVISIIVGIWLINKGYKNLVQTTTQQKNFLLSITHELKSPIAAMKLALDTLRLRNLSEEQVKLVSASAIKDADRLENLVNDLLLAAKFESSYLPYFENNPMQEAVDYIVEHVRHKHPNRDISYHLNPKDIMLEADSAALQSVLYNLLDNAIKYSEDDQPVKLQVQDNGAEIEIVVSDQGFGISDKEKQNIFKKFYRIGSEETRNSKGTGLGLYIINEIVKSHKGKIKVLNNEPNGTIFKILLPKKQAG